MEGEKNRGGPIVLDWNKLLPPSDDEPLPVLVVTSTTTVEEQPQSAAMDGDESQSPFGDCRRCSDLQLIEDIERKRQHLQTYGPKLKDRGERLRIHIKFLEEEMERRKGSRALQDDDGSEKPTQSQSTGFSGASNGFGKGAPSSRLPSQSSFASNFCRKMEENTDCRRANAFDKDFSVINPCVRRKMKRKGHFSPGGRHKSVLSSRQRPFQSPSSISLNFDKGIPSNGDQSGRRFSSSSSPCHFAEDLAACVSRKINAFQFQTSNNLRPRDLKQGQTVVLVDEDEMQVVKVPLQEEKIDECMRETKIYYPSRDDPESVEIHFSDMNCLAPEAYLSSSIMNFYIRYLQQPTSSTDYHFFNTYFYKKLKEDVLNKHAEMETSFTKFRRWWKGINIFEKAYILLPIHESLHWSLVIICIPDKEDESGPIVLHLDSLGLHISKSIFDNIKRFLKAEWNYLNQEGATSNLPIADKIWENLPRRIDEKKIEVPQQKNEYDCGLFVLFFMQRFIEEAPDRLKKKDLAMFGKRWFKPEEASGLRHKICVLLKKEFKNVRDDTSVLDL